MAYFGIDGKPILSSYGYASATWGYDPNGNAIDTLHFDVDGTPLTIH